MINSDCKILLVDDEPDIIEFLKYNLGKENYQIETANNGVNGVEKAKEFNPHIILLDMMMPGIDGVETCRRIRALSNQKNVLISFLSARTEEFAEVAALDAGADGYLFKPISMRLLTSHIHALARRHPDLSKSKAPLVLEYGLLKLDRERYQVFKEQVELELSNKEFEILWLLTSKPGKVFLRNEIQKKVWGSEIIVGTRTMDVHISKLRNKVGKKLIKTVKGIGYKLEV